MAGLGGVEPSAGCVAVVYVLVLLLTAAAQAQDPSGVRADPGAILGADRATLWQPGLVSKGGIPARSTICATLTPRGPGFDDKAQIQTAIDRCPPGQVVQLDPGTFIVNGGNYVLLNKGISLRGAGPGRTTLLKQDGAKPFSANVGANPSPLLIVGPSLFSPGRDASGIANSVELTADAVKGTYSIDVTSAAGISPGEIVLLDEVSGASWQSDRQGRGQIWAAEDYRVVWRKHDPFVPYVDHLAADAFPTTPGTAGSWFSRPDRPTAEIKQVASVSGSRVTFTTPVHISYRVGHAAQLSRYAQRHVMGAGVEGLTLIGGDAGNLRFQWAASSWAKNVESTAWHGEGIAIDRSLQIELREFYVHDAAWAQPGGGGYGISLAAGSSEVLIENGIVVKANKLIVSRAAGAGSVFGYNYVDMSYINTNGSWIEVGLNASHMVGPHHVLFEGNLAQNADSDNTHGNSIYLTFFRNHLRGIRAPFENQAGGRIDDRTQARNGPRRAAGLMGYSYWMSFVGNVLGAPGEMNGWAYETTFTSGTPGIWMLGWDAVKPYQIDDQVKATLLRHGNFDYATNSTKWDASAQGKALPNSMYLAGRPNFFNAGRGYVWPWVDPIGSAKLHTLPAKARYDAGTPFVQP